MRDDDVIARSHRRRGNLHHCLELTVRLPHLRLRRMARNDRKYYGNPFRYFLSSGPKSSRCKASAMLAFSQPSGVPVS
jgi:hypothetical protein